MNEGAYSWANSRGWCSAWLCVSCFIAPKFKVQPSSRAWISWLIHFLAQLGFTQNLLPMLASQDSECSRRGKRQRKDRREGILPGYLAGREENALRQKPAASSELGNQRRTTWRTAPATILQTHLPSALNPPSSCPTRLLGEGRDISAQL